ncbi:hypothetical protein M413DRAFT_25967 [Hebeloma cylindrosporum]|uniref:Uncharacterized protein n=1 Tax=Hebeloma cylindrosporum TaxID=76867 RepID=A0A0C3C463_HEBCY|nr:hypothetical protein M413DRAFT_25967 [Hebeloma cylindrosporum h7]
MSSSAIILDNPELAARLAELKTEQQDFLSLVACLPLVLECANQALIYFTAGLSEVFDKLRPDSASAFIPLAIAAIDYCHRFCAYFYAYHCPQFSH